MSLLVATNKDFFVSTNLIESIINEKKKVLTRTNPKPIGSHFLHSQFPAHYFKLNNYLIIIK